MKRPVFQSLILRIIYKGPILWFLKMFVGVGFSSSKFLKNESQFILLANHNSHLDTLSLLSSLPGEILWRVKPVAASDYFGNTRFKAALSNFFINTLLIRRKAERKEYESDPIETMIGALDAGYSLILFPEGTRGVAGQMDRLKPGVAKILLARPHIKYIPVFMTGMGESLPKGEVLLLPHKAAVIYGKPTLISATTVTEIMEQITADFEQMRAEYQPVIEDVED